MPRQFPDSSDANKENDVNISQDQLEQLRGELQLKDAQIARLLGDVRNYETEIRDRDELIDELANTEQRLKDAQKANTKLTEQIEREKPNDDEIAWLRAESDDLATTISSLRQEISKLTAVSLQDRAFFDETTATIESENQDAIKQLEQQAKQQIDSLKTEIEMLNKDYDRALLTEKSKHEKQAMSFSEEIERFNRQLTDAHDSLESTERRLQEQQSEMSALIAEQGETINQLERHSQALETNVAEEQLLNTGLRDQIRTALQANQNTQTNLDVANESLQTLRAEQTQLNQRAEELEHSNADLLTQVDALSNNIRVKTAELNTTQRENANLQGELQGVRSNLAESEARSLQLQQHIDTLVASHEETVADLRQRLEILDHTLLTEQGLNAGLREQMLRTSEEKDRALAMIDELNTTLTSTTKRLDSLQQTHKQLEKHSRQLEDENSSLSDEVKALKATISAGKIELRDAKNREKELSTQLGSTQQRLARTESRLGQLQEEKTALVNAHELQITAFKQESDELKSNLAREQELNRTLQGQLKTALQDIATLRTTNTSLKDNARQREAQIAELLARIQQLEAGAHRDEAGVVPASEESGYEGSSVDEELSELNDPLESEEEEETVDVNDQSPIVAASPRPQTPPQPAIRPAAQPPAVRPSAPATRPADSTFWTLFLQHGGVMTQYFQDELVEKGNQSNVDIPLNAGLNIEVEGSTEPLYELKALKKGDCIHSTAKFPKQGSTEGETVVGKLVQDHTGKVTNITTDELSDAQQCMIALRQAEMILNNFKPKVGRDDAIIISGRKDKALEGKRLIAALLVLKDNPRYATQLKSVQIISNIPGCTLPKPTVGKLTFLTGKKSQETVNQEFINKFLPPELVNQDWQELIQKQVGKFQQVKTANNERVQEMKQALHNGREAEIDAPSSEERRAELMRSIEEQTMKPGDKIDLDGNITPRR